MSSDKFILASIASALSGAVIGVLLAPEKGSKMRKSIAGKGDEVVQELKRDLELLSHDLSKRTAKTRKEI